MTTTQRFTLKLVPSVVGDRWAVRFHGKIVDTFGRLDLALEACRALNRTNRG